MATHTVAIVGSGFSGTLLALHLLRHSAAPDIVLLDRSDAVGRGIAYSTRNPNHRLNVPAKRMSAFTNEPDDFLQWLNADGARGKPGDFVSRWLFGCYVRQRFDETVRGAPGRLKLVTGDVRAISMEPTGGLLHLVDGHDVYADQIVLATGNSVPQRLPMADEAFLASSYYRGDPWTPDALAKLDLDASVLLVGTGLTMVDMVISLLGSGHRGPIRAISRRGLLPHAHVSAPPQPYVSDDPCPTLCSKQLRRLRRDARAAAACGLSWQAVMDDVRHRVQEIWCRASEADRRRFLRHARPWWDIHRHRIAPDIALQIDQARTSGQLRIGAGRISLLRAGPDAAEIAYTPRGCSEPVYAKAARVINCTGPACDIARSDDLLFQSLLSQGLAQPDKLRLGLNVTQQGEVIGSDGNVTPQLYAVGPITRGIWWEITSVPDIRGQCARLANHIG